MTPSAYHISHIPLDQQHGLPELDWQEQGHYLVFWWKEIALGHAYIEPGEKLPEQEYYRKLCTAIKEALDYYSADHKQDQGSNWQQLLLDRKLEAWKEWMEQTLTKWAPVVLPVKVPVSVVICTRNRASALQRCLTMLQNLSCLPEEIIVVDNAPTDESTYDVVCQFDHVHYIKEPRAGLDIARNTGAMAASAPIVAYTDDDVVVHPLWVYRVWETFQNPSVAAMTGLVIASNLDTEAQLIFEKHWSFNRGYADKVYDTAFFAQTLKKGPPVWKIGAGANMAFRKSVFEEVGLFDELLDVGAAGCNGDSEMWYRILESGHTICYNPRAVVHHEHRREIAGLQKQIFYYMRGFTTAALLQQQLRQEAGYKRHLFRVLPKYYIGMLRRGFPHYSFQYRTLWFEITGCISGLAYYLKHGKQPLNHRSKQHDRLAA